jgi:hypothetical protein
MKWHPIDKADKSTEIIALSPEHGGGTRPIVLNWFEYNGLEAWRDWDCDSHSPTHFLFPIPPLPQSPSSDEERSDEVSAADKIASLTHKIESLRADLANCERRAEEAEARNDFFRTILDLPAEDIAEIRAALAKKVKK